LATKGGTQENSTFHQSWFYSEFYRNADDFQVFTPVNGSRLHR